MNFGCRLVVLPAATIALVACTSDPGAPAAEPPKPSSLSVIASEQDVALTNGDWVKKIPELSGSEGVTRGDAVPFGTDTLAVLFKDKIAVVGEDGTKATADCAECAGLAISNGSLVTTRTNLEPGGGFDLVFHSTGLEVERVVPARRLTERGEPGVPAENDASPETMAADDESVVVGYLSRIGGVRRGPSIIAKYSLDGTLLESVSVDGILGLSSASADQRYLAVGVGGSGGACITASDFRVVDLETMTELDTEPAIPIAAIKTNTGLSGRWFNLRDVSWWKGAPRAVGQVFDPGEASCDDHPTSWLRGFDVTTETFDDKPAGTPPVARWTGPDCDDLVGVEFGPEDDQVVSIIGGKRKLLESYTGIIYGPQRPDSCR